jgi:asparagine synthase (glutamine-hydrolysing)
MSGILGFAADKPQTVQLDQLRRALRLLEYRGLDDRGILLLNGSGPSRLFLGPASEHSHSSDTSHLPKDLATVMLARCHTREKEHPSAGKSGGRFDGRVFLACDGLVDNAPELSGELQKSNQKVQASSQLEVLLAAFEQWGPDCLSRVAGSFAFAVVDLDRRSLILARDAFGTRPLYFARQNDGRLYFSSHMGALLEIAPVPRRANRASLYRYLAYNIMEHRADTFFEGIEQLAPGHYLEVSLDKPTHSSLIRYRRVVPVRTKYTFEGAAERVRELVARALVSQVGAHTAVGAALSGGFDSSFVAASFKRANPDAQLKLYTCVPVVRGGAFSQSEEAWADLAAAGLKSPLNKVRVTSEGLPGTFAALVSLHGQPFSSPVVFAQLQVFRAAQNDGVTLMLSGQGGDTMFASSTDLLLRAVLTQVRRGRWASAAALLRAGTQLPEAGVRRLAAAVAKIAMPESLQAFARRVRRTPHLGWIKKQWFELDPAAPPNELGFPMLRFEDRNSTACSILNRMPLLTTELQDFVCSLPPDYLVTANQPLKSLESAAMQGIVPDAILGRRERTGFPVPAREWLGELAPWVETNITEISCLPFLEPRAVRQTWENVKSKGESTSEAFLVWRWIFLAGWIRVFGVSLD